jgi:hypothetical protein
LNPVDRELESAGFQTLHLHLQCDFLVSRCFSFYILLVPLLDGTSLVAGGRTGAVSVIAIAESGALYDPGAAFYMVGLHRLHPGIQLTHSWKAPGFNR